MINASTAGSTNYPAWGLSETYDRYGNRSAQGISSGCTGITCPQPSVTISATTNRITGSPYAYDASGNMIDDGQNTLVYDGENHAASATVTGSSSGTYTYDGNGLRVQRVSVISGTTTTTVYVFSGSKVIAEYVNGALPSAPTREYIYAGSALLAKIDSSGTKYYHQDHLSNRLVTDSSGNTLAQMGHFPYGESWYNATNDKLLFTTYERDSESGNDYAMARYHVSRLARFSSPDPLSGNTRDPQSLNRYSYVRNMPVILTDPSGLCGPVAQNRYAGESRERKGGGPSTGDLEEDPEPQGPGGCIILDWGDITDTSGSEGAGFPIGGGVAGIFALAFTVTDWYCPNSDCAYWQWQPIYGQMDLLDLLGGGLPAGIPTDPGPLAGPGGGTDPCKTAKIRNVGVDLQGTMQVAAGLTITQTRETASGLITGVTRYTSNDMHLPGDLYIAPNTSINLQYYSGVGLTMGVSRHGIELPTGSILTGARLYGLDFNNGRVTRVVGQGYFLGIPVDANEKIRAGLNSNKDALQALGKLAAFLGKCAGI